MSILADSDASYRMNMISQAIELFIYFYDKVAELIKGKSANVIKVETGDLNTYSKTLIKAIREKREEHVENNSRDSKPGYRPHNRR